MKLFFLFIRGFPGSGKTTLAQNITSTFKAVNLNPDKSFILKTDAKETTRDHKVEEFRELLEMGISNILSGKNIVWDQPWRKVENIQYTVEKVENELANNSKNKIIFPVIEIVVDKDLSWERCTDRFTSREYFDDYISKFQRYDLKLPYLELDGSQKPEKVFQQAQAWLINLGWNITP